MYLVHICSFVILVHLIHVELKHRNFMVKNRAFSSQIMFRFDAGQGQGVSLFLLH